MFSVERSRCTRDRLRTRTDLRVTLACRMDTRVRRLLPRPCRGSTRTIAPVSTPYLKMTSNNLIFNQKKVERKNILVSLEARVCKTIILLLFVYRLSSNCVTPQQSHPPKTNNNRRVVAAKAVSRHRGLAGVKDDLSSQLEHATGLEDIKMAIEQLTLRSHGSRTSYSTSTYSSLSGSEGGGVGGGNGGHGSSNEPMRRLIRHSSLETINTNVTVADEFVWVDSYNRLVELQQLPWSNHDILRVIQNGRIKEHLERVSMETVPRLSYLLQRALVRVARETQRLARPLAMCSKQEVCSALRIVLSPALADSCIKVRCIQSLDSCDDFNWFFYFLVSRLVYALLPCLLSQVTISVRVNQLGPPCNYLSVDFIVGCAMFDLANLFTSKFISNFLFFLIQIYWFNLIFFFF